MTSDRPLVVAFRAPTWFLGLFAVVVLVAVVTSFSGAPGWGPSASPPPNLDSCSAGAIAAGTGATSIATLVSAPSESGAGAPTVLAWQAVDTHAVRVVSFAVPAELSVTDSGNGSNAPAWANASTSGPLARSANGTFSIPTGAWSGGVLSISVVVGAAGSVTVRLFGPSLPALPAPIALTVLPDLSHLVLYNPQPVHDLLNESRSYSAFWHVRDRFGDPAPGATLLVEFSTGSSENETVVPVVWTTGGATGAWVNYTARGPAGGTLTVLDEAGTTLLGPMSVPAASTSPPASAPSLSPLALAGVAILAVGGVGGIGALLYGGRARRSPAPTVEEEELRRLAEGRATVVEILRRAGPLPLSEVEARWEPPPAPPALADWVASLVTDGTLTAEIGEGGRARFALVTPPEEEPRVTLDEEALERGIARRDAAVARDDEGEDEPAP